RRSTTIRVIRRPTIPTRDIKIRAPGSNRPARQATIHQRRNSPSPSPKCHTLIANRRPKNGYIACTSALRPLCRAVGSQFAIFPQKTGVPTEHNKHYRTLERSLNTGRNGPMNEPVMHHRWELREDLARDLAILSLLSALATAVVPAALAGISSGAWLDTALCPLVWLLLATGVTTGAIGLQDGIRHARLATIAVASGGLLLNA